MKEIKEKIKRERMIICRSENEKNKNGVDARINDTNQLKRRKLEEKYSQHTTYTNTNDRQQCRCFNQVMQTANTLHQYKCKTKTKLQTLFAIE